MTHNPFYYINSSTSMYFVNLGKLHELCEQKFKSVNDFTFKMLADGKPIELAHMPLVAIYHLYGLPVTLVAAKAAILDPHKHPGVPAKASITTQQAFMVDYITHWCQQWFTMSYSIRPFLDGKIRAHSDFVAQVSIMSTTAHLRPYRTQVEELVVQFNRSFKREQTVKDIGLWKALDILIALGAKDAPDIDWYDLYSEGTSFYNDHIADLTEKGTTEQLVDIEKYTKMQKNYHRHFANRWLPNFTCSQPRSE